MDPDEPLLLLEEELLEEELLEELDELDELDELPVFFFAARKKPGFSGMVGSG